MKKCQGRVGKSGHIYVSLNRTMCVCIPPAAGVRHVLQISAAPGCSSFSLLSNKTGGHSAYELCR